MAPLRATLTHPLIAFTFVLGLSCENELSHRPASAVLVLSALESDIFFDDLQAVTRQRQHNRVLGDRQEVEKVGEHASSDAVAVTEAIHVLFNMNPLVVVPVNEGDVAVLVKNFLRGCEKTFPSLPSPSNPNPASTPMNPLGCLP